MHWTQLISTEMYVYVQLIAPYKLFAPFDDCR
jgi:hypothetical protein